MFGGTSNTKKIVEYVFINLRYKYHNILNLRIKKVLPFIC